MEIVSIISNLSLIFPAVWHAGQIALRNTNQTCHRRQRLFILLVILQKRQSKSFIYTRLFDIYRI